jgi:hypothetical protein
MIVLGADISVFFFSLSPGEVQGSLEESLICNLLRESENHCVKDDSQIKGGLAMLY